MSDTNNNDDIEMIRTRKDDLESELIQVGLYLQDWNPLIAKENVGLDDSITHAMMLQCSWTVGDLAFDDRVQNVEKNEVDEQFEAIVNADIYDRAIDAQAALARFMEDDDES